MENNRKRNRGDLGKPTEKKKPAPATSSFVTNQGDLGKPTEKKKPAPATSWSVTNQGDKVNVPSVLAVNAPSDPASSSVRIQAVNAPSVLAVNAFPSALASSSVRIHGGKPTEKKKPAPATSWSVTNQGGKPSGKKKPAPATSSLTKMVSRLRRRNLLQRLPSVTNQGPVPVNPYRRLPDVDKPTKKDWESYENYLAFGYLYGGLTDDEKTYFDEEVYSGAESSSDED